MNWIFAMTALKTSLAAIFLSTSLLAAAEPAVQSPLPPSSPRLAAEQAKQEVERAAQAFYLALHDRDLDTIARLMPPQGFSEFSSRGGPLKQQTLETVRAVFAAGVNVDVRLENLNIEFQTPDVALVTGLRIGIVSFGPAPTTPQTRRMSSLWVRHAGEWQLTHIHYSALE